VEDDDGFVGGKAGIYRKIEKLLLSALDAIVHLALTGYSLLLVSSTEHAGRLSRNTDSGFSVNIYTLIENNKSIAFSITLDLIFKKSLE